MHSFHVSNFKKKQMILFGYLSVHLRSTTQWIEEIQSIELLTGVPHDHMGTRVVFSYVNR